MKVPQVSYAGGELAPELHGRPDLEKFQSGLALAENMIIRAEGGAAKRPGLYYVGQTKFGPTKEVALVSWRIALDDSYLLEFGDFYVRFIRFGAVLPTEIATPWPHSVVRELKFAYSNDVIYIFHSSTQIRRLERTGLATFNLTLVSTDNTRPGPLNLTAEWKNVSQSGRPPDGYQEIPVLYKYKVSAIYSDGTESPPTGPIAVNADLGNAAYEVHIKWDDPTGIPAGITLERLVVYKEKGGLYGFMAYADPGEKFARDNNIDPDYATVPKRPFKGFNGNPGAGGFYRQRLSVGKTIADPQNLWFSVIGQFNDFSETLPVQDDDGFSISLEGGGQHTIQHIVQLSKLIVFTNSAEWVIDQEGEGFSISTVNPRIQSYYGSERDLTPILVNERVLFVEALSNAVRDFGYSFQADAFVADELSRLSRHLFRGTRIQSWAHAPFPYDLVFAVTDNGQLPTMTYLREDEIWAWSHSITQGSFYAVGTVPEITENAAYFLVDRELNGTRVRCIERMQFTYDQDVRDAFYVDCGLTYEDALSGTGLVRVGDVFRATVPGNNYTETTLIELSWLGQSVACVVSSISPLTFAPTSQVPLDDLVMPTDLTKPVVARRMVRTVSGLGHLEGMPVHVLADGSVLEGFTVTGGSISLPSPAARVHVGLGYIGKLRTLDLDAQQVTAQGRIKSVSNLVLRLRQSRGVFAGSNGRTLYQIRPREFEYYVEPNQPLDGMFEISVEGDWRRHLFAEIELPYPLPAYIQSIIPDIEYAD